MVSEADFGEEHSNPLVYSLTEYYSYLPPGALCTWLLAFREPNLLTESSLGHFGCVESFHETILIAWFEANCHVLWAENLYQTLGFLKS